MRQVCRCESGVHLFVAVRPCVQAHSPCNDAERGGGGDWHSDSAAHQQRCFPLQRYGKHRQHRVCRGGRPRASASVVVVPQLTICISALRLSRSPSAPQGAPLSPIASSCKRRATESLERSPNEHAPMDNRKSSPWRAMADLASGARVLEHGSLLYLVLWPFAPCRINFGTAIAVRLLLTQVRHSN